MASIPVTMQGLRPVVETSINGKPAAFLLDSGAFYSTISPPAAKALGLALRPLPFGFRLNGVGGSSEAWVTTVERFSLAKLDVPRVEFVVGGTDIGQTGLLGQNVLGLADVEYDLPGGMVRLFRANDCGKAIMAYWTEGKPYFVIPIEPRSDRQRHTVATVQLDGAKLNATFDTGAARTVISLRAAARAGVHPGDPGVVEAGWSTGLGHRVAREWIGRFNLLKIGEEELHNVRLRITDLGAVDTDMLLGADYFVSHRLYVSNSQHRIYFTYNGGRLFDTSTRVDPTSATIVQNDATSGPTAPANDAEDFSRRGAMFQTQHDMPHAVEAFSKAITLAPQDPRFPRQRALAYLIQRRPVLALDDLNTTLTLDPKDVEARMLRADLRLRFGNPGGAIADLDSVAGQLPREDATRMRVGQLYSRADAFDAAIGQFDLWLDTHRDDAHRAEAQNGRCWARALANKDLDQARRDCDAAIREVPGNASFLDSRGLVAFRRGDGQAAIADLNAALAIHPSRAWPLYIRSLAEKRLGQAEAASRDQAAALALDPHLPDRARKYGLA
ncbi:aspartyl protease family protein [Sphingomonadaceae bacterium jetA1]|uniref:aspartyl protease family protein n=1 Tax=Facivitalis istanbulensis TaxID=3075838 RepID=UPI0034897050